MDDKYDDEFIVTLSVEKSKITVVCLSSFYDYVRHSVTIITMSSVNDHNDYNEPCQ